MPGIEALDLGDPVSDLAPAHAEPAGQLVAQVGLEQVAGGLRVLVDRGVVEPGPAAIRPLGRVGDQDVGVELRIAGTGGAVLEGGGEEAVAADELGATVTAPRPARLPLHVVEGTGQRLALSFADLAGDLGAAERPKQRDGLRRREGEIEAGDRAATTDVTQAERRPGRGVVAGQHRRQLIGIDLALEAEFDGGVTEPVALGLALSGVVVLRAFGDLRRVVALLAGAELADRDHLLGLSSAGRDPSQLGFIPLLSNQSGVCTG